MTKQDVTQAIKEATEMAIKYRDGVYSRHKIAQPKNNNPLTAYATALGECPLEHMKKGFIDPIDVVAIYLGLAYQTQQQFVDKVDKTLNAG